MLPVISCGAMAGGGAETTLLLNLEILSRVKPHEKVNAKAAVLHIEPNGWWPVGIARYWRSDDRGTLMSRVQALVEEAKRYLRNAQISCDGVRLKRFLRKLAMMITGLTNLKQTYANDTQTVAHLELIIEYIKEVLKRYSYEPPTTVVMDDFHGEDDTDDEGGEEDAATKVSVIELELD